MATNLVYKFQIIYKIHRDRLLPQKKKKKKKKNNSKRRQKVEMLVMKSSNKEM